MNNLSYDKFQVRMRVIILLCASFANSRFLLVNLKDSGKDASSSRSRPTIESQNIPFSDRIQAGKILNILANTFLKVI